MKHPTIQQVRKSKRPGTVLIVVLITALLVGVMGVSALHVVRVERRMGSDSAHSKQAALNAQAGLNLALSQVENNNQWRQNFASGNWAADRVVGDGWYNVVMIDPVDGNLTNKATDPVEIVATGKSGAAIQRLELRLDSKNVGYGCLQSAIHAKSTILFKGTTVNTDHWTTSNSTNGSAIRAQADSTHESVVRSKVAAVGGITKDAASSYVPTVAYPTSSSASMPNSAALISQYTSLGTSISAAAIPYWDANQLTNPSMEGPAPNPPTTGWTAFGTCTLAGDTTLKADGTYSLRASGRSSSSAGPMQDISGLISKGVNYNISVSASSKSKGEEARLVIEYRGNGFFFPITYNSPWVALPTSGFATITGSFTPFWLGTLSYARLRVETQSSTGEFYIDAASLREDIGSYPANKIRAVHRRVISPTNNPFAPANTNPNGVYHINLATDEFLSIQRSRIVGTLIVTGGAGVDVWDKLQWEPAISNYPAIVAEPVINFRMGDVGASNSTLSEVTENVNLNPASAPYQGSSDSAIDDSYTVLVRGIVYSKNGIDLKSHPVLEGVLISDGTITSAPSSSTFRTYVDVTYLGRFYNDPPPGFIETTIMKPTSGSLRQLVD